MFEKQREILVPFIVDVEELEQFRRKLAYPGLTEEGYAKLVEEYGHKLRREQGDYLPHSDNYLRERARLSGLESKQYIQFLLSKGYLVRNEEGSLEISDAGVAYLDELNKILELRSVKSLNELAQFSLRRKRSPSLALMLACLWR
jgi:hypothetical protein